MLGEILDKMWMDLTAQNFFELLINSKIASALVILIVGVIVARIFSDIIRKLLVVANVDTYLTHVEIRRIFKTIGYDRGFSDLLADLIRWLLYSIVAFSVAYAVGFVDVMILIKYLLVYLSKILIAAGVFVFGLMLGDYFKKGIIKMLRVNEAERIEVINAEIPLYIVAGTVMKYFTVFVFILLALAMLDIGTTIIYIVMGSFLAGVMILMALSLKDLGKSIFISIYFQMSKIILKDQTLEVGGVQGTLVSIGSLYTKIKRKNETVLVPNSVFVKSVVKIKE